LPAFAFPLPFAGAPFFPVLPLPFDGFFEAFLAEGAALREGGLVFFFDFCGFGALPASWASLAFADYEIKYVSGY
jgi:hypothetical protein